MVGDGNDAREPEAVVQGKKGEQNKVGGSTVSSTTLGLVVGVWREACAHYNPESNLFTCGEREQNQGDCIGTEG